MSQISPSPFLSTRFNDESLLLATEPIFDVSLGEDGDESWLIPSTPGPSNYRSIRPNRSAALITNKTLDLDMYLPEEVEGDREVYAGRASQGVAQGSGERIKHVESSLSIGTRKRSPSAAVPSSIPSSLSSKRSHRDDLFARRLSHSRRSGFSPAPKCAQSAVNSIPTPSIDRRFADVHDHVMYTVSIAPSSVSTSDSDLAEVQLAWKEQLDKPCPRGLQGVTISRPNGYSSGSSMNSQERPNTTLLSASFEQSTSLRESEQIPLPTLTELSDADSSSTSKDEKRLSRSERLVDFFTGFLSVSQKSVSRVSGPMKSASRLKEGHLEDMTSRPEMGSTKSPRHAESNQPTTTSSTHPPLQRPSIPGYIPLTRPLCPRPFQTTRTVSSSTSHTPRLASTRFPNNVGAAASSSFASAALAKLPPPGKGSTSASKPVRVRTPERARDLAVRRKVFERKSTNVSPLRGVPPVGQRTILKTVPVTGRTPGKASRARAEQRMAYDRGLKERLAERQREKEDFDRLKAEMEEEEYLRRRSETVIWAKPIPSIYKKAT